MSKETWFQIVCDKCGERTEPSEPNQISETELRADLKKRLGWISYRTDVPRGHVDICPACKQNGGR